MGMVYTENKSSADNFYHSIRIAEELGFDMVKIWCPDDLNIIEQAVEQSNIPIFIAGGNEIEEQRFVEKTKKILEKMLQDWHVEEIYLVLEIVTK